MEAADRVPSDQAADIVRHQRYFRAVRLALERLHHLRGEPRTGSVDPVDGARPTRVAIRAEHLDIV